MYNGKHFPENWILVGTAVYEILADIQTVYYIELYSNCNCSFYFLTSAIVYNSYVQDPKSDFNDVLIIKRLPELSSTYNFPWFQYIRLGLDVLKTKFNLHSKYNLYS